MYTCVFKDLYVRLPFTKFECDVLRLVNIAPSQFHPNSWAFLKAFEIFCKGFGVCPTIGVFFSFYNTNGVTKGNWVSISAQPNRGRFALFQSSYKNFKEEFVRVRNNESCPELMFEADGGYKFPIYWEGNPVSIKRFDFDLLNDWEQDLVDIMDDFCPIPCKALIDHEFDMDGLQNLLRSMSGKGDVDFKKMLARVKAEKAAALKAGIAIEKSNPKGVLIGEEKRKSDALDSKASSDVGGVNVYPVSAVPSVDTSRRMRSPKKARKEGDKGKLVVEANTDPTTLFSSKFNPLKFVSDSLKSSVDYDEVKKVGMEKTCEMIIENNLKSALASKVIFDQFSAVMAVDLKRKEELIIYKENLRLVGKELDDLEKKSLGIKKKLGKQAGRTFQV